MNMSPVARLKKTWSKVNTDKFEILEVRRPWKSHFFPGLVRVGGIGLNCLSAPPTAPNGPLQ